MDRTHLDQGGLPSEDFEEVGSTLHLSLCCKTFERSHILCKCDELSRTRLHYNRSIHCTPLDIKKPSLDHTLQPEIAISILSLPRTFSSYSLSSSARFSCSLKIPLLHSRQGHNSLESSVTKSVFEEATEQSYPGTQNRGSCLSCGLPTSPLDILHLDQGNPFFHRNIAPSDSYTTIFSLQPSSIIQEVSTHHNLALHGDRYQTTFNSISAHERLGDLLAFTRESPISRRSTPSLGNLNNCPPQLKLNTRAETFQTSIYVDHIQFILSSATPFFPEAWRVSSQSRTNSISSASYSEQTSEVLLLPKSSMAEEYFEGRRRLENERSRKVTPSRQVYPDYGTAHSSITAQISSPQRQCETSTPDKGESVSRSQMTESGLQDDHEHHSMESTTEWYLQKDINSNGSDYGRDNIAGVQLDQNEYPLVELLGYARHRDPDCDMDWTTRQDLSESTPHHSNIQEINKPNELILSQTPDPTPNSNNSIVDIYGDRFPVEISIFTGSENGDSAVQKRLKEIRGCDSSHQKEPSGRNLFSRAWSSSWGGHGNIGPPPSYPPPPPPPPPSPPPCSLNVGISCIQPGTEFSPINSAHQSLYQTPEVHLTSVSEDAKFPFALKPQNRSSQHMDQDTSALSFTRKPSNLVPFSECRSPGRSLSIDDMSLSANIMRMNKATSEQHTPNVKKGGTMARHQTRDRCSSLQEVERSEERGLDYDNNFLGAAHAEDNPHSLSVSSEVHGGSRSGCNSGHVPILTIVHDKTLPSSTSLDSITSKTCEVTNWDPLHRNNSQRYLSTTKYLRRSHSNPTRKTYQTYQLAGSPQVLGLSDEVQPKDYVGTLEDSQSWSTASISSRSMQSEEFMSEASTFDDRKYSPAENCSPHFPSVLPSSTLFPLNTTRQQQNVSDFHSDFCEMEVGSIQRVKRKPAQRTLKQQDSGFSTSVSDEAATSDDNVGPATATTKEKSSQPHQILEATMKNHLLRAQSSWQTIPQSHLHLDESLKVNKNSAKEVYKTELHRAVRDVDPDDMGDVSKFLRDTNRFEQHTSNPHKYYSVRYVDGDEVRIHPGQNLNGALREAGKDPIQTFGEFSSRITGHKFVNLQGGKQAQGALGGTTSKRKSQETLHSFASVNASAVELEDNYGMLGTTSTHNLLANDTLSRAQALFDNSLTRRVRAGNAAMLVDEEKLECERFGAGGITGVTTSSNARIGRPRRFDRNPNNLPETNSFILSLNHRMKSGQVSEQEIRDRINMANDDWQRLKTQCPQFPLREDHLILKFPGRDRLRCKRLEKLQDGTYMEQAWCFAHNRWEFSHNFGLARRPATTEEMVIQRRAGRILLCFAVIFFPFGGGLVLWDMKEDTGSAPYLMRACGSLRCDWVNEDDREAAGTFLKIFGGVTAALCTAALAYGYYHLFF